MNLTSLQKFFHTYLLGEDEKIKTAIKGENDTFIERRLDIYADSYRDRLHELLAQDFPGLKHIMGDDLFLILMDAYIDAYPPTHFSPRYLGQHLELFLKESKSYAHHLALQEMAHWEYLLLGVLEASNEAPLSLEVLQAFRPEAWPDLKFKLHPSVHSLNLYCNVPNIWHGVCHEKKNIQLIQEQYSSPWIVWRSESFRLCFQKNNAEKQIIFEVIKQGKTFSELCEVLCQRMDEVSAAHEALACLTNGFQQGWFIQVQ